MSTDLPKSSTKAPVDVGLTGLQAANISAMLRSKSTKNQLALLTKTCLSDFFMLTHSQLVVIPNRYITTYAYHKQPCLIKHGLLLKCGHRLSHALVLTLRRMNTSAAISAAIIMIATTVPMPSLLKRGSLPSTMNFPCLSPIETV